MFNSNLIFRELFSINRKINAQIQDVLVFERKLYEMIKLLKLLSYGFYFIAFPHMSGFVLQLNDFPTRWFLNCYNVINFEDC